MNPKKIALHKLWQEWFLQKIYELTQQNSIQIQTRIVELDLSSLQMIGLIGEIEETFDLCIEMNDFMECETLEEVIAYCVDRLYSQEASVYKKFSPNIPYHGCFSHKKWKQRVEWLEHQTAHTFSHLTQHSLDPEELRGNIENFIGAVEVPVGIAGPLWIHGKFVQNEQIMLPLATSEGALISSICRGAKALNLSGGVQVQVEKQQMVRAPVFFCQNFQIAQTLKQWVLMRQKEITQVAESVSRHAKLIQLDPLCLGKNVHIRFIYQTGDAAGQNMTTLCTDVATHYIDNQFQQTYPDSIIHFYIEGGLSGDKKVTGFNYHHSRGITVQAYAVLSDSALQSILKVERQELLQAYHSGMMASIYSHMLGFNANIANLIAGIFVSTGQDIASVHESSIGQFHMDTCPEGLWVMLYLPSLIVGTVGGGTGLPRQQDVLKFLNCQGSGKVFRLAEMIASFALALELSTLSAIVGGQFVAAHERLGRNRPVEGFKKSHLTPSFLQQWISLPKSQVLHRINIQDILVTDSILTDISKHYLTHKWVGHLGLTLQTENGVEYSLVLKSKATDQEVMQMNQKIAGLTSREISLLHRQLKESLGFKQSDLREIKLYQCQDPLLKQFMPEIFGTYLDLERELFLVAMENLDQPNILLKNTASSPELWHSSLIENVLTQLAYFHSLYYESYSIWEKEPWIEVFSKEQEIQKKPLWEKIVEHQRHEFPDLFTKETDLLARSLLTEFENICELLSKAPKTLIHNDCNPRNLCLKTKSEMQQLILFDWELACIHVPQRDVCEFLAYVLTEETTYEEYCCYVEHYYQEIQSFLKISYPKELFWEIYTASCQEFLLNRLGLYSLVYTLKDYDFFERVFRVHTKMLQSLCHTLKRV